MALTKEQSIEKYGTERYTAWGETEAAADAAAHPEYLNTYGQFNPNDIPVSQADPYFATPSISVDDYITAIQETLPMPPEEYLKANPFYFDEQSARDVSTAEFAPYYDEILNDYLTDIKSTTEKNQGDTNRILADLDKQKELFMQQNASDFDKMIRGIKEGYSAKGLYFSGTNLRDQTEAQAENTNKLEGYLNTYGGKRGQTLAENTYAQNQAQLDAQRRARDIGREKEAGIAGGIQTQKNEALDEYLYGMQTYYKAPNWKSIDPSKLNIAGETGNTLQQQGTQY